MELSSITSTTATTTSAARPLFSAAPVQGVIRHLLWWEVPWVTLLALPLTLPGHFLPLRFTPTLVLLLFIFWPLRLWREWCTPRTLRQPLLLPILVLLATLVMSLIVAVDLRFAWLMAAHLALGIALCMAFVDWPPMQRHPGLVAGGVILLALTLSMIGPALLLDTIRVPTAVALWRPLVPLVRGWNETLNANILAGGLLPALPLAMALAIAPWGERWWQRVLGVLRTALLLVLAWWLAQVLSLTDSRGAWLAAVASLLLVVVLRWPRLTQPVVVLLGVGLLWLLFNEPVTILRSLMANGMAGDYNGRMEIWVRSWQAFRSHWLTGIGIGGFVPLVVEQMAPVRMTLSQQVTHAHNLLLQVAVDLGIFGLLAYVVSLVIAIRCALLAWRTGDARQRTLATAALGALAAIHLHGLLDAPLWNSKLAFVPWLVIALALLAYRPQNALLNRARITMHKAERTRLGEFD